MKLKAGSSTWFGRLRASDCTSTRDRSLLVAIASALFLGGLVFGCADEGSQTADTGGIGGTGISQGTITAFGSIFVNGIEWDVNTATIEVDGTIANETDLRVGMRVRVVGEFSGDGLSGSATSVRFDDSIEGPIGNVPVLTVPGGPEKSFTILGHTILVDEFETVFADGASFAALAKNQVLEVSGFDEGPDTIRATRVALRGLFPAVTETTLSGSVQNLTKNPDGSGIFDISGITIRYLMATEFEGFSRDDLVAGRIVDVSGALRVTGSEIDADEIELEDDGLGQANADDVELEGVVSNFVSLADFELDGVAVDASGATLEPMSLVVADGSFVEVEGSLVGGVILADVLKSEDDEEAEVSIRAAISSVDANAREVTILGVVVFADGETEIQDERDGDENFQFSEIAVGDWLDIEGFEVSAARVRAKHIVRKSAEADVVLAGSVTDLDEMMSTFSILDQPISVDMATAYFNVADQPRTEEEFFRTPGDVSLGDAIEVVDENALVSDTLGVADTVDLE